MKNRKIALTISSGRPIVKKVVKAFIENAVFHGFDYEDFFVYISIDTEYFNSRVKDFIIGEELSEKLNKIKYITKEDRDQISEGIANSSSIDRNLSDLLFSGRGYSKQRNSALIHALRDGCDYAICVDDDSAPIIPVKKEDGKITWKNLDFFGPHIKALSEGADITRGPYMGYQSPIPSDFEKDIPEEIREKLGEALELGNDVITRDSFFNLMNKVKYLPIKETLSPTRPFVVESGAYGKTIYAGNMGINLAAVREGRIPIFYTPPSRARGEDSIFALQLDDVNVVEVNSFIFHDPFTMYPNIFDDIFPKFLEKIPITKSTKWRFADSLIGWLKYAPILIRMTCSNDVERDERITEMLSRIEYPTSRLADIFDCPDFNTCYDVLNEYHINSKTDYENLLVAQEKWRGNIIPVLNQSELVVTL